MNITCTWPKKPYLWCAVCAILASCNTPEQPSAAHSAQPLVLPKPTAVAPLFEANTATEMGRFINCIVQDKSNNYWFGTNDAGVYRCGANRQHLIQFTEKDGLSSNQVHSIQEDSAGNILVGTSGGVNYFDGSTITTLAVNTHKDRKIAPHDRWFAAGSGAYCYNGSTLTYLRLPKAPPYTGNPYAEPLGPYSVYCTFKDRRGRVWLGTQTMGVCCYDPSASEQAFTWLTQKGLSGPAVRGLFEDQNGDFWFGNNGYGLFRYDTHLGNAGQEQSLSNFTTDKGLGNPDFLKNSKLSGKDKLGTLARVWSIQEDQNGDLWIGTTDAGAWRYDGKDLTNYTTKDGLSSNAINTIYRDKQGTLWFGTDGAGVCTFNGTSFERFIVK